jgi:uncharacterized protein YqeY
VALDEAQLQRELQDAMRGRDRLRIDVLRGLIAAIKNVKVERQVAQLPEAEIVGLVRKELNKRTEIIGFARQAGRAETEAQAEAERAMLEAYLPQQMDAAALDAAVRPSPPSSAPPRSAPSWRSCADATPANTTASWPRRSSRASHNEQRPVAPASVPGGRRQACGARPERQGTPQKTSASGGGRHARKASGGGLTVCPSHLPRAARAVGETPASTGLRFE